MRDRFWDGYSHEDWKQLSTSATIDLNQNKFYQPGSVIMRTAATPKLATDDLSFFWLSANKNEEYYIYMHFAEFEELPANQSRQLEVTWNGELFYGPFSPTYLTTYSVWSIRAMSGGQYNFSVVKAAGNSDLPPILNAIEIYRVKEFSEQETNEDDG